MVSRSELRVGELTDEELEEAVQLVGVATQRRRQVCRVGVGRGLDRPHLHLEPAAEPLHAPEHAHGVTFGEAAVEQLDVVPDPRVDPSARIDELEREVRRTVLRPASLLTADGVDAFDGSVLGELGDAGHASSLVRLSRLRQAREAGVRSGRGRCRPVSRDSLRRSRREGHRTAVRRAHAGAPRRAFSSRDPHNVVHLTLNESEDEAGRLFRTWLDEGVLVRDDEPAVWAVRQEYVGPDGVARRREGLVASLRVEPYETGTVLPHERTHAGPKESRLRLLRAARAQLEPIFLLYDGEPPVARTRP